MPNNIKEGDYIELGQLGAYSLTFRTNFNGFYSNEIHELSDKPIMSLYDDSNEKVGSLVTMNKKNSSNIGHNKKISFK